MLLDLSRAISFLLSVLSFYALLGSAFFITATTWEQRLVVALARVVVAACVSCASGMLFRYQSSPPVPLLRTLPVRLFLWTLVGVAVLFTLAWLLDTYYVPLLWRNQPWLF